MPARRHGVLYQACCMVCTIAQFNFHVCKAICVRLAFSVCTWKWSSPCFCWACTNASSSSSKNSSNDSVSVSVGVEMKSLGCASDTSARTGCTTSHPSLLTLPPFHTHTHARTFFQPASLLFSGCCRSSRVVCSCLLCLSWLVRVADPSDCGFRSGLTVTPYFDF